MSVIGFHKFYDYVKLEISGKHSERFLNLCRKRKYPIWDVKMGQEGFSISMKACDYRDTREMQKRMDCQVCIVKEGGMLVFLKKYQKRECFLLGLTACLLLLWFVNGFIWKIDVAGCERISDVQLLTWLEENPQPNSSVTDICPLVGNASIPARNYQSNENVRLMAQQLGAVPHFLYLPALPDNLEEKQLLCSTEVYRQIDQQWEGLDTALVNIGNYPSSPDFASLVRYGSLLQRQHACGRMLVYYFNEEGTVIQSDQDFAIQVPLETLKRCPNIIGVCSANTSAKALRGALRSGVFTHIVARSSLAQALLD